MGRSAAAKAARLAKKHGALATIDSCGSCNLATDASGSQEVGDQVVDHTIDDALYGPQEKLAIVAGSLPQRMEQSESSSDSDISISGRQWNYMVAYVKRANRKLAAEVREEVKDTLLAWGDSVVGQVKELKSDIWRLETTVAKLESDVVDLRASRNSELQRVNKLRQENTALFEELESLRDLVLEQDINACKRQWDTVRESEFASVVDDDSARCLQDALGGVVNVCGLVRRKDLNGCVCVVREILGDGRHVKASLKGSTSWLRVHAGNIKWPARCYGCGREISGCECFGCSYGDKYGPIWGRVGCTLDCDEWSGDASSSKNSGRGGGLLAVGSPQDVNVHGVVSRMGAVDDECQAMPSGFATEFTASANSGSSGSEAWLDDAVQGKVEDELE